VSLDDARQAVDAAKALVKRRGRDALQKVNTSWATRLAALQAAHDALAERCKALGAEREQAAAALHASRGEEAAMRAECEQLQRALEEARQEREQRQRRVPQLEAAVDELRASHAAELDQVRVERGGGWRARLLHLGVSAAGLQLPGLWGCHQYHGRLSFRISWQCVQRQAARVAHYATQDACAQHQ
jgi:hypothetical protein